mgnify:CR=1 FL=1
MFIEFTFDPKLLFILIYPIFKVSEQPIINLYMKKDNDLFKIFRIFLSNVFSFIFLLILKCKNKSNKNEIIADENEKSEECNEVKLADIEFINTTKKNRIKSILFIFLLSILYAGSYFFNYYVRKTIIIICRNSIGIIYEIIVFYILSLLILKEKYYKHHFLSISIICLTLIILFITYVLQVNDSDYSIYNALWYYLVYYSLYGLFDILLKKYFLIYFYSIYFVLLIIGAFVCIPMLIYDIIAYFLNKNISGVIIGFINNTNSVKSVFLFILHLLFLFISNLGLFWTIYYFTPFYLIICEFILELLNYYIRLIQYKLNGSGTTTIFSFLFTTHNIVIFTIVFFINFICSLIFNEIIILKFLKLEYYTKKYINVRAQSDANAFLEEISSTSGSGRGSLNES